MVVSSSRAWAVFACAAIVTFAAEARKKPDPSGAGRQEQSVAPGINDAYLKPDLDASIWVERFEHEGREVFDRRNDIVAALRIRPGMTIADVGAGTGLFTFMLARETGPSGKVLAVDIVPAFLERIAGQAEEQRLMNIETVLGTERAMELPQASVDIVFICDTYHHFEYPRSTLASIRRALRPGGALFVVEFKRIPGQSSDWILNHVRAGQDEFATEIQKAGFEFTGEFTGIFKENYMLRFRWTDRAAVP